MSRRQARAKHIWVYMYMYMYIQQPSVDEYDAFAWGHFTFGTSEVGAKLRHLDVLCYSCCYHCVCSIAAVYISDDMI